jgi:radical SAM superfamily enzyme
MTMDCHHCGNFGHKKYECTSKCRVGCKWCDKPPSRRQPSHRSSIEIQRQHSNVNIQRSQGSTSKYIFIFLFFTNKNK